MASDVEIERFFYFVHVDGLTSRKAVTEVRDLAATLQEHTGLSGEIYGFRGNC